MITIRCYCYCVGVLSASLLGGIAASAIGTAGNNGGQDHQNQKAPKNPMTAGKQIPGPTTMDPETVATWHKDMQAWREEYRNTTHYTGEIYSDPRVTWTQTSYMQPQMHPYDRYFYDRAKHKYTVQTWLNDVNRRYGGVDSILMWPTYTNIGTDDRSQFDLFEAMPGGLPGVRAAIDELHAAGVKVLIPYNPWDIGTRRCGAGGTCGGSQNRTNATVVCNASICNSRTACTMCDARIITGLLKEMNGDGFNGDTMGNVPEEFYRQSRLINHSIAIEPEGGGGGVIDSQSTANWDTMGWGYWKYPDIPNVDTWKWLDSRRMTNVCERWQIDHTNALQGAWFNGDGFETWENVWGTWNGITERDGEQIRRLHILLRFLGKRGYLRSQGWLPHSGTDQPNSVFASYWPLHDSAAWTVVSRGKNQTGKKVTLANIPLPPKGVSWHYYDLWAGTELEDGQLELLVERDGYGGMLATPNSTAQDPELAELLSKMKAFSAKPLDSFDPTWKFELGSIVKQQEAVVKSTPSDMVRIPGGKYRFVVQGVMIEGGGSNYNDIGKGVDVQHPWEPRPNRFHSQYLNLKPYYIDITPVTQQAFAAYLRKQGASALPADRYHFLLNWDWSDPSMPKPGYGNGSLPVTYIGYSEAQAYCSSLGRRLPTEIEWQYAAQGNQNGTDGEALLYPWGETDNETLRPTMTTGNIFYGPESVDRYSPAGDSKFGIKAMVGNVWQMTDHYMDGHTSSVILRGGSNYRPSGSGWYLPQTLRGNRSLTNALNEHEKYFLMDDRYERAGTIGFRCAADVPASERTPACRPSSTHACGSFDAPDAFTTLTGDEVKDWATYGRQSRMMKGSGSLPTNVTGEAVTYCPQLVASVSPTTSSGSFVQPQIVKAGAVSFSFTDGTTAGGVSAQNITTGLCSPSSLRFTLPLPSNKQALRLTLWAGVFAGTLSVNASIGGSEIYSEELTAAPSDFTTGVLRSNRFDFIVPAVAHNIAFVDEGANAQLVVEFVVSKPHIPPPPPPPPPPPLLKPCKPIAGAEMCLNTPATCQKGKCPDVGLDWPWIGGLDWLHWVNANFVRKQGTQELINCACKGQPCTCHASANIPGQPYGFYKNNPTTFGWTNGTKPVMGSKDPQGADLTGAKLPGGTMENLITIPPADDDIIVHLFTGTCSSTGSLNISLLSSASGEPLGSALHYEFTKATGGITNQHFTIQVPPAKSTLTLGDSTSRVLHTSWSGSTNVEFQSIAVTTRLKSLVARPWRPDQARHHVGIARNADEGSSFDGISTLPTPPTH